MAKQKFHSKSGFILASIGATVGLGNALRFPGLCAKYGGGTFLLIYLIALIVLGIPLLNAEIALGRKFGGGAPECMANLCKKRKGIGEKLGWASSANSLVTAVIYAGLAGWIIVAGINIVPLSVSADTLSRTEISNYFFENTLSARSDGVISDISLIVALSIAVVWVLMFFCLKGGASALSKCAKFTVIIPIVLLVLLAGRGLMYHNSAQALHKLFVPDLSRFADPDLWLTALGQVFFSLSVVVGVMPAYGAYLPEGTNIFRSTLYIAGADFLVSVLSSVVLFTTLYGCNLQTEISQSGIITAFAIYPVALTRLFGTYSALNAIAGVAFYLSLFMMAVQSAVSMAEAFISPLSEKFAKNGRNKVVLPACAFGLAFGVLFATSAGVAVAEISDTFINFYNVLLLACGECLLLARYTDKKGLVEEINKFTLRSKIAMPEKFFNFTIKFLCPLILVPLALLRLSGLFTGGLSYAFYLQFAFGFSLCFLALFSGFIIKFAFQWRPYIRGAKK